jgi:hypothetical protein
VGSTGSREEEEEENGDDVDERGEVGDIVVVMPDEEKGTVEEAKATVDGPS